MRAPFPNGEPMDAWKARVGTVWLRRVTHCLVTQVGTRSHLFTMSTRCLCAACLRRYTLAGGRRGGERQQEAGRQAGTAKEQKRESVAERKCQLARSGLLDLNQRTR